MWKRKKKNTLENVPVTKLLDDFVDLDVEDDSKRAGDMSDDEYIRMMLKKDEQRQLERQQTMMKWRVLPLMLLTKPLHNKVNHIQKHSNLIARMIFHQRKKQ